ncbi:uncharacterized protein LOC132548204 [Ylistrum balloti]|uniref:uncharacterized protein LOC132548204 n=1 Tax=Ylistrum balloti TaxID=509963 RepID=UPI002905D140|nr:uncharacterized protein LOC132548204 [Ylistrum balloti]
MDQVKWLFVILFTSIHTINGQMKNVCYKVVDSNTKWENASHACRQMNGTLIDNSELDDNFSNITLTENKSYWTSAFSFVTRWVELKGCFTTLNLSSTVNGTEYYQISGNIGLLCYARCHSYTYFGITGDTCLCFSANPLNHATHSSNNCPACSNHSRYQCGTEGYTAVYEKRPGPIPPGMEMCESYNCQPGEGNATFAHQNRSCEHYLKAKCSDGFVTRAGSWIATRNICESNNSFIFRHPVAECQNDTSTTPFWDNVHRDMAWFTIGMEYHFDETTPCNTGPTTEEEEMFPYSGPTTTTSTITNSNTGTKEAENMVVYIAIGAGGLLVLILIVVAIICICQKRSKQRRDAENEIKNYIDLDVGLTQHIEAAERYLTMKSEKSSEKCSEPEKSGGGNYDQITLPEEKPDNGSKANDSIVNQNNAIQRTENTCEIPNEVHDTETEDHYTELDGESADKGNLPKVHKLPEPKANVAIVHLRQEDDDYDHFGQTKNRSTISSNYDHVHLINSQKLKKETNADDAEDYDHIPGAGCRRENGEADSIYDHAQVVDIRESTTSNYDHVVLTTDKGNSNRLSDDYDHTSNVNRVEIASENRDSHYTHVTLGDTTQ